MTKKVTGWIDATYSVTEQRLHAMDALRCAALLVVIAHAAVSYMRIPTPGLLWVVYDQRTSPLFDWIFWWAQIIAMPLFFLVAGFFATKLYESLGPRSFLLHRTKRIFGPLIVGSVTLLPATFCVWAWGWLISGRCTVRDILRMQFSRDIQSELYGFAHLWFLQYLFLLCVAFWIIQRLIDVMAARAYVSKMVRWSYSLVLSPWKRFLPLVPTILILSIKPGIVLSFHNSFFPDPLKLLYYSLFFAVGLYLYRIRDSLECLVPSSSTYLLLSIPLFGCASWLLKRHLIGELHAPSLVALAASIALLAWLSVFGLVGLSLLFFNQPRPAIRYLSDASYWIYLCHLPILGLLQTSLSQLPWPVSLKFFIVVIATLALSLFSYQSMVRYTFIGLVLNGQRISRRSTSSKKRIREAFQTYRTLAKYSDS